MPTTKNIDVKKIKVSPATSTWDIDDIKDLLSNYHPLGCNRARGKRMYFIATYNREWVAALVFDAPVKSNHMREREIG